jgi:hypothetical protein
MFVIVPALLGWYHRSKRRRVQRAPLRPARESSQKRKTISQATTAEPVTSWQFSGWSAADLSLRSS